jgi:hypothetical protein
VTASAPGEIKPPADASPKRACGEADAPVLEP